MEPRRPWRRKRPWWTASRDDTSLNQDYWDAGYEKGQWFTKGLVASIGGNYVEYESLPGDISYNADTGNSNAYGLKYVPYDGYPAMLHQGERVLTARRPGGKAAREPVGCP